MQPLKRAKHQIFMLSEIMYSHSSCCATCVMLMFAMPVLLSCISNLVKQSLSFVINYDYLYFVKQTITNVLLYVLNKCIFICIKS
jgi:hypothetical protein